MAPPIRTILSSCLAVFLLETGAAAACSCGRVPTIQEALDRAESVFAGRVVETWPILARFGEMETLGRRITFRISTTWKGDPGPEIVLAEPVSSCSYPFRRGGSYLVFTLRSGSRGERFTTTCMPTGLWAAGGPESRMLGPGRSVAREEAVPPESRVHHAGRRLKAAVLGSRFLIVPAWSGLADSPRGVVLRLAIELAGCAVLAGLGIQVRRGRGKRFLLILAAVCIAAGLFVLGVAYHGIATNPWLQSITE